MRWVVVNFKVPPGRHLLAAWSPGRGLSLQTVISPLEFSRLDPACNGEIIVLPSKKKMERWKEKWRVAETVLVTMKEIPKKLFVDRRLCRRGCGKTSTTRRARSWRTFPWLCAAYACVSRS